MSAPANLQRLSVRDASRLFNVSERLIYMAGELLRSGRADLIAQVDRGELTILGALKLAVPEKYAKRADGYGKMMAAWAAATADERRCFLEVVADDCYRVERS